MEITLYIVQSEYGGIPEEPLITTDEAEADKEFIRWWDEEEGGKGNLSTIDEVSKFMEDFDGQDYCRYWVKTIQIEET